MGVEVRHGVEFQKRGTRHGFLIFSGGKNVEYRNLLFEKIPYPSISANVKFMSLNNCNDS